MTLPAPPADADEFADPAIEALYREIVRHHAADLFGHAARTIADGGSVDETFLLRIVLARLLITEPNSSQLAARAATLANAVSRLIATRQRERTREEEASELDTMIDAVHDDIAARSPGDADE